MNYKMIKALEAIRLHETQPVHCDARKAAGLAPIHGATISALVRAGWLRRGIAGGYETITRIR